MTCACLQAPGATWCHEMRIITVSWGLGSSAHHHLALCPRVSLSFPGFRYLCDGNIGLCGVYSSFSAFRGRNLGGKDMRSHGRIRESLL